VTGRESSPWGDLRALATAVGGEEPRKFIPLAAGSKIPQARWRDPSNRLAVDGAERHVGNLAIATGAGFVVLDADVPKGGDPIEDVDGFLAACGFPATAVARSQRGGVHVYLAIGGHEIRNRTRFVHPALPSSFGQQPIQWDVRGAGGLIVLPGSVGEVGRYSWHVEPSTFGAMPPALLEALRERTPEERAEIAAIRRQRGSKAAPLGGFAERTPDEQLRRAVCPSPKR